ncbi:hypothetical protein, partial [Solidesulfovibrio sp.]|uniref:hypothetical protein n=1 Tax=Solidesulfovibrio sp. TaxID=2910990 RepID=UPI002B1EEABE
RTKECPIRTLFGREATMPSWRPRQRAVQKSRGDTRMSSLRTIFFHDPKSLIETKRFFDPIKHKRQA